MFQVKWKKGPFRLLLNSAAFKEISWHCKHYTEKDLMKNIKGGENLAKEMNIDVKALEETFNDYNKCSKEKKDEFGTKFF